MNLVTLTNHVQGIYLYVKFTPRKPNNIQSFTVDLYCSSLLKPLDSRLIRL